MRQLILPLLIVSTLVAPLHAQNVARLEIFPTDRIRHGPTGAQQLAVIAHFDDGSTRDVTQLTAFTSSDSEIARVTLKGQVRFQKTGEVAIFCRYGVVQAVRLTYIEPKEGFVWRNPPEHNAIDRHVFAKLKQMQITPSDLCADEVFLRRAYIDACGMLPTPAELHRFTSDKRDDKRARLIDELLQRPEFADRWAHHLVYNLDLPIHRLGPTRSAAYLHWARSRLANDAPLDRIVRDMLVGTNVVTAHGPVSFYGGGENPAEWASRASHNFLGVHIECMACHQHQRARFTSEDYHGFVAFFAQVYPFTAKVDPRPIDMILLDKTREWRHPLTQKPVAPRFLDGTAPALERLQDRRPALADWVVSPKNPYFARTLANRIWMHLLGKGIGDPVDQLHELPFSTNDPLLDYLATELKDKRFDLKHVVRLIMNSRAYQLDFKTNEHNKDDVRYFARAYPRRFTPEVMADALAQVTEIPAFIDGMPLGTRAMQVLDPGDGAIFGRQPCRVYCEADRPTPVAALHLLGSNDKTARLAEHPHNRLGRLLAAKCNDRQIADELFLVAFCRLPTDAERKLIASRVERENRRRGWEEILWAILHANEFAMRR